MNDQLLRELTDIADGMPDTDLRALRIRVGSRSRYLRVRRAMLRSAAAVVAVAGLAGGAVLVAPSASTDRPTGPEPVPAARITDTPGTLTFLDARYGTMVTVIRVVDGVPTHTTFGRAMGDEYLAVPSPDGSAVAAIRTEEVGYGALQILTPLGRPRTLAERVPWGHGWAPVWTPDGKAVIVGNIQYAVATGRTTVEADPQREIGYRVWSPSATWRAYSYLGRNTVVVSRADGSDGRTLVITGLPTTGGDGTVAVQAVSDDGRYLALGDSSSGLAVVSRSRLVYDTQTGRPVALPDAVGQVRHIWFRAGGDMFLHSDRGYLLVTMDGTVNGSYPALPGEPVAYSG